MFQIKKSSQQLPTNVQAETIWYKNAPIISPLKLFGLAVKTKRYSRFYYELNVFSTQISSVGESEISREILTKLISSKGIVNI